MNLNKRINPTAKERQSILAQELAAKMKLEKPFAKDLRRLFNQIATDYAVVYGVTGQVPLVSIYKDDLNAILRNNYRKIEKKFKGTLVDSLDKSPQVNDIKAQSSLVMAEYIRNHSTQQTNLINRTTQNDLNNMTRNTIVDAAEQGERLSNEQVATDVKRTFKGQIPARADTISMTETLNVAETTKETEAGIINASNVAVGGVVVKGLMQKIWNALFDIKTRPEHARADGQTVPVWQTFLVAGESLRRPGDSRGSAGNIINCRCGVTYELRKA